MVRKLWHNHTNTDQKLISHFGVYKRQVLKEWKRCPEVSRIITFSLFLTSCLSPSWQQAGPGSALLSGDILLPSQPRGWAGLQRGRRHHPHQSGRWELVRGLARQPIWTVPRQLCGRAGASAFTLKTQETSSDFHARSDQCLKCAKKSPGTLSCTGCLTSGARSDDAGVKSTFKASCRAAVTPHTHAYD